MNFKDHPVNHDPKPSPQSEQAGEKDGDNMSIDALLSEFNRQGINTENWDGDEGAEKAIVDGVVNGMDMDEMVKEKDYWYNRCYQAEQFIEASPCDPDITKEQIEAHKLWKESQKR